MKTIRGTDEIDIRILCKAATTYYNILLQHYQGVIQLPKETIKFYTDRLLEGALIIEDIDNKIYDSFSEDVKALLAKQEEKRNNPMRYTVTGTLVPSYDSSIMKTCVINAEKRYNEIREEAERRLTNNETE